MSLPPPLSVEDARPTIEHYKWEMRIMREQVKALRDENKKLAAAAATKTSVSELQKQVRKQQEQLEEQVRLLGNENEKLREDVLLAKAEVQACHERECLIMEQIEERVNERDCKQVEELQIVNRRVVEKLAMTCLEVKGLRMKIESLTIELDTLRERTGLN